MSRQPAVAGMFYDANKKALIESLEKCFLGPFGPGELPVSRPGRLGRVLGLVSPHAGYIYSGAAAAHAYSALAADGLPDIAIILGPNHSGMGAVVAVSAEDKWLTPLGEIEVDRETAQTIVEQSEFAEWDDLAHAREHSIEVQLPFLQYLAADPVRIVPICLRHLRESDALKLASGLGPAIAHALDAKSAVIIASTDFTHYESRADASAKDAEAMEQIINLDPQGLLQRVYKESITMCGVIGTAVMLEVAKLMGASSAKQLAYYTSGDITGDIDQVVGYGALSVEK